MRLGIKPMRLLKLLYGSQIVLPPFCIGGELPDCNCTTMQSIGLLDDEASHEGNDNDSRY